MLKTKTIQNIQFWNTAPKAVIELLHTHIESGLTSHEAIQRSKEFGKNTINTSKRTTGFSIFFNQLKSPLIVVLIIASIVTVAISHYRDAIFIFIAVIVNSVLGFYQENKAERALADLKTYLKQRARVIRDGHEKEVEAEVLVPGDIIRLSQGDRVPADARVLYVNDLQVDEAILTGESLPVQKSVRSSAHNAGIADQSSMLFAGTLITQGMSTAVVCRTSQSTELGKIASLIGNTQDDQTPLQIAISTFSIYSSIALAVLTAVVFIIGILSQYSALDMFLTAVALAVSAIPEGLPVSMTVILAVGVERMAKRKGVVRKLVAAEALGGTTVILTDKTGTLTMAQMILSKIIPYAITEQQALQRALANTQVLIENPEDKPDAWRMTGKIMETALVRSAALRGMSLPTITNKEHVIESLPFNSVQKYSASIIRENKKFYVIYFGAPDILIKHASLSGAKQKEILDTISTLASSGERVLGLACKAIPEPTSNSLKKYGALSNITFNGLITFRDPIRPGIKQTISRVMKAGIKTVVMTGDHQGTAIAVAKQIGLYVGKHSVLDASELANLSEEELRNKLPQLSVISRVTPYDKLRVAKLFQDAGEVVAMTGDGVNDAPSIKQANVGIAMGSGTEVAQSVADLVLLDDNFETIVAAVEEGRQILNNIRKVLVYLLSNVTDGLILIGGSLLTGLPLPLNPLQILWVNFFTDSFPAIAFAFEKDKDSLSVRPSKNSTLFDPLMKFLIIVIGVSTSALLFIVYYLLIKAGYEETLVRTFIFGAFGTYTLMLALSVRNLEHSIFSYSLFSNRYLTGGITIGIILMIAAIYIPTLQQIFQTVALPLPWVGGVLLVGLANMALIEIAKFLFRARQARKS